MSYGRSPHYIWSDNKNMRFDLIKVPETAINQMLYHMLLSHRREELKERLLQGRSYFVNGKNGDFYIDREDSVLRKLMDLI
jgi:hypothetical protein